MVHQADEVADPLEEHAVVADEIDDGEGVLSVGLAEAAAELLQEDDGGLGGAEHHDAVDGLDVHALVEHVDRADRVEGAVAQGLEGELAIVAVRLGVHAGDALAVGVQPGAHVLGVGDRAAEHQRAGAGVGLPGAPQGLHAVFGLGGVGELREIEAAVSPGDGGVVDVVADAVVVEGDEEAAADRLAGVGPEEGAVAVEEADEIGLVGALGGWR